MREIEIPQPPCGGQACATEMDRLARAGEHCDTIGIAKGLIMAARNCGPDEAFEVLRTESMHRNEKLWGVAESYVSEHAARGSAQHP